MNGVFISYRQADAKAWAVLLRDALVNAFGEHNVFLDEDTLGPGLWRKQIENALRHCKVVLVVIGQRWLSAVDKSGERRLWQSDDVHRQEIELVLTRSGVTVIPVLVDGMVMPRREDLPPSIGSLVDLQARVVSGRGDRRQVDVKTLISDIEQITGLVPVNPKPPGRPIVDWLRSVLRVLITTIAASIAFLVTAQITGGWTFDPEEISTIVLIIFIALMLIPRVRKRSREIADYAGR